MSLYWIHSMQTVSAYTSIRNQSEKDLQDIFTEQSAVRKWQQKGNVFSPYWYSKRTRRPKMHHRCTKILDGSMSEKGQTTLEISSYPTKQTDPVKRPIKGFKFQRYLYWLFHWLSKAVNRSLKLPHPHWRHCIIFTMDIPTTFQLIAPTFGLWRCVFCNDLCFIILVTCQPPFIAHLVTYYNETQFIRNDTSYYD